MRARSLYLLAALSVLLTGCGPTVIPLHYSLSKPHHIEKVSNPSSFSVTTHDRRAVSDSRMLLGILNSTYTQYGPVYTENDYVAEKPFIHIIHQAITDGLTQMGLKKKAKGRYTFTGNLIAVQLRYIMGDPKITIKLDLSMYDTKRHTIAWQETLIGRGSESTSMFQSVKKTMRNAVNAALTDLIRQMQQSDMLIHSLQ